MPKIEFETICTIELTPFELGLVRALVDNFLAKSPDDIMMQNIQSKISREVLKLYEKN